MLALCRSGCEPKPNSEGTPMECRYATVDISWSLLEMAAMRASSGLMGVLPLAFTAFSSMQDSYISPIFCWTGLRLGLLAESFCSIWCRIWRLYSANSLNRPQRAWSEGMGLFLRQFPQAYSEKSSQGLTVLSMALRSNDFGRATGWVSE